MKVTIEIDDDLMAKAKQLSNHKTKKAVVEEALKLFVVIEVQAKLKDLCGKIELDVIAFQ
jgi:Arc/MetJ family transcription regulator